MEPLLHLVIPLLIVSFFTRERKYLYLSVFTLVPDIDFLLIHRSFFHSLSFLVIVFSVLYFLEKRDGRPKNFSYVSSFYLLSHLILDSGYPGIRLLYPFSRLYYYFNLDVIYAVPPIVNLEYGSIDTVFYSYGQSHLFTDLGLEFLLIVFSFVLIRKKVVEK